MERENRKRKNVMCVYLTEEEYQEIINSSTKTGLSISKFARNVCLGAKVTSKENLQDRVALRKINGDLGRLGGLLKLAIESDNRKRINLLLDEIQEAKNLLKQEIEK